MLCEWSDIAGCERAVNSLVLTGCLGMHVEELYFCPRHAGDYVNLLRIGLVTCKTCPVAIAEYLVHNVA
jgi:hypothetical protein